MVQRLQMTVLGREYTLELFSDNRSTAHPTRMEAVSPHLEGLKPLFDVISPAIIKMTAQFQSREGIQVVVGIDEKLRF